MEQPHLVIKPDIPNALVPQFAKYAALGIIALLLLLLAGIDQLFSGIMIFGSPITIFYICLGSFILVLLWVGIASLFLHSTTYSFYDDYVLKEFKFLVIKRASVPYSQIVNLTTVISIWDRLSKAGDIVLHTAEDRTPDVVLKYVNRPEGVEREIHAMIRKHSSGQPPE
ncbi:MAG: PH domain-containing protein [archaeon]